VTLLRLALAFAAAALLFIGWEWAAGRRDRRTATAAAAEALVLTLFASLFFGSLGHGGWPLVFLLVGLLASGKDRWLGAAARGPMRPVVIATALTATRYIVAGGLLALLLG